MCECVCVHRLMWSGNENENELMWLWEKKKKVKKKQWKKKDVVCNVLGGALLGVMKRAMRLHIHIYIPPWSSRDSGSAASGRGSSVSSRDVFRFRFRF